MDYLQFQELYHHGVKGMKWGERKQYEPVGRKPYKKSLTTTQKVLIGVGGVAVTAATAYGITKAVKYSADTVIQSGIKIQRISTSAEGHLYNEFYASKNKHDNKRYEALLPQHLKKSENKESYKHIYKTSGKIKVASNKHAKEVYKELVKNGKINANIGGYNMFNRNLVNRDEDAMTFYEELKRRGYGAIQDLNDKKYSGYNTNNPLIFFGDSKNMFDRVSTTKLKEIPDSYNKEVMKTLLETCGKKRVKLGSVGATIIYGKQLRKNFKSKNK